MSLDHVVAFKQIRPGDELEGVKEWTNQFTGTLNLVGEVIDFVTVPGVPHEIPHGLGRVPVGAMMVGSTDVDFSALPPDYNHLFRLDASTDQFLRLITTAVWTGGIRVVVW